MGSCNFQVNRNILLLRGGMQCGMTTPTTTLVEEWTGQERVELQDKQTAINGFLDFWIQEGDEICLTNESIHYHHWSGFCLSNGYSCQGCVEQVSLQENVPKSVPPFSGVIPSWVHVFFKSTTTSSCCTQAASLIYLIKWKANTQE